VLGSRPSIIDWPMGKLAWLKDRQMFGSKQTGGGIYNLETKHLFLCAIFVSIIT
jgi:hypothetical protein